MLNSTLLPIDKNPSGVTNFDKSGTESNDNEEIRPISQSWSLTIKLFNAKSRTLVSGSVLTLFSDAVGVFYTPFDWAANSMLAVI